MMMMVMMAMATMVMMMWLRAHTHESQGGPKGPGDRGVPDSKNKYNYTVIELGLKPTAKSQFSFILGGSPMRSLRARY